MTERGAMSGKHDCGGDAAAYALGALEPDEATAFRRHLEQCVVCRDELEALQGVVQALPMSAPQHPTPAHLRRRLMRAIRQERRASTRARELHWPVGWAGHRASIGALVTAAAVALAIVGGLDLSSGPAASHVIQARVEGISGSAELRISEARGELIVHHLSAPPPGHVYEVWLKAPGTAPKPASVLFGVSSNGAADVGLPDSLRGVTQVMVTPEPDGGSLQPTHAPVIVARLS